VFPTDCIRQAPGGPVDGVRARANTFEVEALLLVQPGGARAGAAAPRRDALRAGAHTRFGDLELVAGVVGLVVTAVLGGRWPHARLGYHLLPVRPPSPRCTPIAKHYRDIVAECRWRCNDPGIEIHVRVELARD